MNILALDLSKTNTGWACWAPGSSARSGSWVLGNSTSREGDVYLSLQTRIDRLHDEHRFDLIVYEEPIVPAHLSGFTTISTILMLGGLAASVELFGAARNCKTDRANIEQWRASFLGKDEVSMIKAEVRRQRKAGRKISATPRFKRAAKDRARSLGFEPNNHDEAEAIGILDYVCAKQGIVPPWRKNEVLRAPLRGE